MCMRRAFQLKCSIYLRDALAHMAKSYENMCKLFRSSHICRFGLHINNNTWIACNVFPPTKIWSTLFFFMFHACECVRYVFLAWYGMSRTCFFFRGWLGVVLHFHHNHKMCDSVCLEFWIMIDGNKVNFKDHIYSLCVCVFFGMNSICFISLWVGVCEYQVIKMPLFRFRYARKTQRCISCSHNCLFEIAPQLFRYLECKSKWEASNSSLLVHIY